MSLGGGFGVTALKEIGKKIGGGGFWLLGVFGGHEGFFWGIG